MDFGDQTAYISAVVVGMNNATKPMARANQECDDGFWGPNCIYKCSGCRNEQCNKTNGACKSGCKYGFKVSARCNDECDDGFWGPNCINKCNGCRNEQCNKTNGVCTSGCKDGFKESTHCDDECQKGTYGQDCNQTCGHCLHLVPCDVVSGRCESCLEGYTGDSCDTLVEESNQFPVELVSGVSTGILILLVALIMSVVLLIRKKKGKRTQEHSNVTTVREPISSVNDEPQQMAAEKSDNEQKCLPAQSADSVTTTVIQEPVYSNMKDLPPVESLGTAIALCQLQGYVMSKSADEPFFSLEFKVHDKS
ncbi:multiple epidermal growth factor-like domains protein 10 [Dreissena polymorpha]|uniref:multiple epidermal growth factor-like domains protein 10 n=1 Tax=Dreissena polymorpha TaxID=45954 RepID=UPI0022655FAD|nr:multiple epidermal growth factor-like domains protein 10 [Dreissena polymorpha]